MTTATEALFTPVQYFTALDPYNWRVDNRPLSDLSDNDVTLSEGIETAFHSGKLNSAALGSTLRALAGNGRMMGAFTVSGSALTANILYSVFTLTANVSGKTVSLVGLQPDLVSFALTAPAAGYKKLHTIAAKYQSPDLDLPYFDSSLALDGSQIATGNLEYEVTSSTVALAAAETYPTPGSGFTEVIRIKVLAADTVIDPTNVTYPNFVLEGQAFNYASQTRAGQVLFATAQDITEGTSTNKAVAPADIASIVSGVASVPQASQSAFGTVRYATSLEVTAGTSTDRVVTPADLKGRIDAIPAAASVPYATQSSSGVVIFANTGEITAGTSTDRVVTPANLADRAFLNGNYLESFDVATAVYDNNAPTYRQLLDASMDAFKAFGAFYVQIPNGVKILIPPKATYRIVVIGAGGGGAGYLTGDGGNGTDSYLTISGGAELCRAKGGIGSKQGTGHSVHDTWPPRGRNAISINGDNLPLMIVLSKNDPDLVNLSKVHNYGQGSPRDTSYDGVPNVFTSSEAGHGGVLEFIFKNLNPTDDLELDATVGSGGLKTGGNGTNGHDGVVAVLVAL